MIWVNSDQIQMPQNYEELNSCICDPLMLLQCSVGNEYTTTWRMIQMAGAWQEAMGGRESRKSHQPKPTVILAALESIDKTIFHLTCGLEL